MGLRRLGAVALPVAFLLVAGTGCNSGSGTSSPTTKPPPAIDAATACSLVTAADATTLFGEAARPKVQQQPKSVASQCIYEAGSLSGQLLQFRIFPGERYYSRPIAAHAKALTKLGSKAYLDTQGPGGIVDLQFVHDGTVYALAYSTSSGDPAARAAQVEALARTVATRR